MSCILACLLLPFATSAQLKTYPLEKGPQPHAPKTQAARTKTGDIVLPFWDDFSFTTEDHPSDALWANNKSVLVSSGQGIQPPTINVATFDGLTASGSPYSSSTSDVLDYGYRDTLESKSIKMTDVPPLLRNDVFLSFYYQAGGNGEPPDPNDFLRLEFFSTTGWETIITLRVDDETDPTVFYDTLLRINQNRFYHDDFRFRFISFGRKSGRYDAWHIDYVYLNGGRSETDNAYPDRSYYTKLSPLFGDYYSMPQLHFKTNPSGNTSFAIFGLSNLDAVDQPMNYDLDAEIISYEDGLMSQQSITLADAAPILPSIEAFEQRLITLTAKPDLSTLTSADSVFVNLIVTLETGDSINTGYEPINFYVNDTLRQSYSLTNYYAYDDGIAEYAAGLTTAGDQLAYRFNVDADQDSIINGLYIYYPFTAGPAPANMEFFIMDDSVGKPHDILYEQLVPVARTANNKFTAIELMYGVIVPDVFYIGYREPSSGRVRIGLDKSNDTGVRMFSTINGVWVQNDRVTGSLMMRPRFKFKDVLVTGVEEERDPVSFYPNPNSGSFYIKGHAEHVRLINMTGQPIEFYSEDVGDEMRVSVANAIPGIYIVQYRSGSRIFTEKILIRK